MVDKEASPDLGALLAAALPDDESDTPPVEVAADAPVITTDDGEQAVEATVPAKLSDLIGQVSEETPIPAVDLATEIELEDGSKVTVKQLIEERLMRKDHTQKTQQLAEDRKKLEAASELLVLLQEDPEGTIASLAAQLGVEPNIDLNFGTRPKAKKDVSKLFESDDKVKTMVAEEAKKLFDQWKQDDPVLKQTAVQASQQRVEAELSRIGTKYNYELDDADKNAIVQVAIRDKEPNLEFVFLKLNAQLEAKAKESARVKDATPRRSTGTQNPTPGDVQRVKPKTIEEAFAMAQLELANR